VRGLHKTTTPNIVSDWQLSKHSANAVECSTCHGEKHVTEADFAAAEIPTPDTCAQCHDDKVSQFKKGKHAFAWAAMKAMPSAHAQPVALMEGMKGCGGCHKLGLKSEADIADLRKAGSGSAGPPATPATPATASRSRGALAPGLPDLPHGVRPSPVEMYSASKHGVRALLKQNGVLPETTAAPTCQTCHMQKVTTRSGRPGDSSPSGCRCRGQTVGRRPGVILQPWRA